MIKQDPRICAQILKKQEKMSLERLLISLSAEEWEEYFKFIIKMNYDPRDDEKEFEMQIDYRFECNPPDRDADYLFNTFEKFVDIINPLQKKRISQALNNLVQKHINNKSFIQNMFRHLDWFTDFSDPRDQSNCIGSFDFESLRLVVKDDDMPNDTKMNAISKITQLKGLEAPNATVFRNLMKYYLSGFASNTQVFNWVICALMEKRFYKDAFLALTLTSKWPQAIYFEESIVLALTDGQPSSKEDQGVTIDFLVKKVIPRLSDSIRKKLVKVIKNNFFVKEQFENAVTISKTKFPVSKEEIALIKAL